MNCMFCHSEDLPKHRLQDLTESKHYDVEHNDRHWQLPRLIPSRVPSLHLLLPAHVLLLLGVLLLQHHSVIFWPADCQLLQPPLRRLPRCALIDVAFAFSFRASVKLWHFIRYPLQKIGRCFLVKILGSAATSIQNLQQNVQGVCFHGMIIPSSVCKVAKD